MRRYTRPPLAGRTRAYLDRKAEEVRSLRTPAKMRQAIRRTWKHARQTKSVAEGVLGVLRTMAGKRERCMYCEDSRGTDIDHFWPKSVYPKRTFEWANMLLSCSGCQRAKGDRFPLDKSNAPLLIDPTDEDPWEHLFYVSETGVITPRYDPATGRQCPKGVATTDLLPLNDEAIACGRKRVSRRLVEAVRAFLDAVPRQSSDASGPRAADVLLEAVRDCPDYGLSRWYFAKDGHNEEPFRRLRANYPGIFKELGNAVSS